MVTKRTRSQWLSILGHTFIASAMALSAQSPVLAQQSEVEGPLEEITVTGSRIRRSAEFDFPTPAQTLSSRDLEISGVNELSEALAELPAITPDVTSETSQSSTQGSGQSTISLRNLGSERTLTLIDGRRTVGNTSTGSTISLDTVPDAFIERIEVITGGASAVYGSDAVTGVVNIIMKDDFDGFQFETRIGDSTDGGNEEIGFSVAAGANFDDDRGNIIFSVEWDDERAIRESQRSLASVALEANTNTNDQPDDLEPSFSSNIPGGLFSGNAGDALNPDNDSSYWFFGNGGTGALTPDFSTSQDGFNFLGPETISIPRERILVAGKMHYDLTENVRYFASAQYSSVSTKSERASDTANSGRLAADFPIFLADGVTPHPFVPQEIFDDMLELGRDTAFMRRRWVELGNRFRESDNDTIRLWTGLNGAVGETWEWEGYVGFGEWRRSQSRVGDLVIPNYQAAINVEYVDPADPGLGLQCADEFARDSGCVPLNPFGLGSVSQAQADWIILRDQLRAQNRTTTAGLWATGELYDLPAGALSAAVGYEYRKEQSQTRWDPISTSGGGTVTQQVNQDGEQDVNEVFLEVVAPLLADIPGIESLSIEAAVRSSDYSTVGSVTSYNYGFTWQPIEDVRVRASFAEANRAPNNIELFSNGLGSQSGLDDPCDNVTATSTGVFADTCRQDPIVAQVIADDGVFVNEGLQVQQPTVGNEALSEETADTFTVGLVFTPRFLEGLTLAIDYYDIEIDGAISEIDADDILQICYTSNDFADNASCQIPIRNVTTGQLQQVTETSLNINALRTSGIDLTARYTWEPNFMPGTLDFGLTITRLDELEEEAPIPGSTDTFIQDRAGLLGSPEYRTRFSANWYHNRWSIGYRLSYVGEMLNDDPENTRLNACRENNNCGDKIALFLDGEATHNLRLGYELPQGLFGSAESRVYAGINNIGNNQGPVLYGLTGDNDVGENSHALYDITGRYIYAGASVRF
ncbi:MAG: TonB-dependent receptor [Pseudomonadota bacterium]